MRIGHVATLLAAGLALAAPAAAAPSKDECVDANAAGQRLRKDAKLQAAREKLRVCASSSCPGIIRDDCNQRLDELEKIVPTVVFEAKDGSGADRADVSVMIDGAPLASRLDGSAIQVEPGEHELTFETQGAPKVKKKLVFREGEKGRRELITLGAAKTRPAESPPMLTIVAGQGDAIKVDSESVGVTRWSGPLPVGLHHVAISHDGKKPYASEVDLSASRSLEITLEDDKRGAVPLWIWLAGGAVVASGMAVGGYFLLRGDDKTARPPPVGGLESGTLSIRFGR